MKKFIINTLVFAIAFFLIEKIFYVFLVISPTLEKDSRLEKVISGDLNKDIIVLGSSRGARGIIAGQIEDSLHLSSYNLSYPGSDIEFHEFLLRSLLKFNKAPKIVLLTVDDPYELFPNKLLKSRLDRLYPLAKYNYINNEMVIRGEKTFLSKFLVLARINKRNFDLREKNFSNNDTIISCGSMPISFQRKDRSFILNNAVPDYNVIRESSEKVEYFLKFQKLCTSNNIKLYLVFPPNFRNHNDSFEKRLRQLAEPEVSFYVYDIANNVYQDKSFFYDESHLQANGAVIFTNEIIKQLKISNNNSQNSTTDNTVLKNSN